MLWQSLLAATPLPQQSRAEVSRASAEPGQRRAGLSLHWSECVGLGDAITNSAAALTCDAADLEREREGGLVGAHHVGEQLRAKQLSQWRTGLNPPNERTAAAVRGQAGAGPPTGAHRMRGTLTSLRRCVRWQTMLSIAQAFWLQARFGKHANSAAALRMLWTLMVTHCTQTAARNGTQCDQVCCACAAQWVKKAK